jgi:hypothetical protein
MILLLLNLLGGWPALPPQPVHDFKMTITELAYQPGGNRYSVRVYFFADDLTEAITGNPKAPLPDKTAVVALISQDLQLYGDGRPLLLKPVGWRRQEEQIRVEFTTPATKSPPATLKVVNRLLLKNFENQTNMVYLIMPGKAREVQVLNYRTTACLFNP